MPRRRRRASPSICSRRETLNSLVNAHRCDGAYLRRGVQSV